MKNVEKLAKLKAQLDDQVPKKFTNQVGKQSIGKTRGEKLTNSKFDFLWRTADKREMALEEMEDTHLINSLRLLANSSRKRGRPLDRRAFKMIIELKARKNREWEWRATDQGFIGYTSKMNFYMVDVCPLCQSQAWKVVKDSSQRDRLRCICGEYTAAIEKTENFGWNYVGEDSGVPSPLLSPLEKAEKNMSTIFGVETPVSNGKKRVSPQRRNESNAEFLRRAVRDSNKKKDKVGIIAQQKPEPEPDQWAMDVDLDDDYDSKPNGYEVFSVVYNEETGKMDTIIQPVDEYGRPVKRKQKPEKNVYAMELDLED